MSGAYIYTVDGYKNVSSQVSLAVYILNVCIVIVMISLIWDLPSSIPIYH